MNEHKWYDEICAWAAGYEVQWQLIDGNPLVWTPWTGDTTPPFHTANVRWRVTPQSEIHWIYYDSGKRIIGGKPTAADALAYAEKLLADHSEFHCSQNDYRIPKLTQVRQLLGEIKNERQ